MTVWNLDGVDVAGVIETHRVTNNHPYAVVGEGWVQAADLQPGMVLETVDGSAVTVLRVRDTGVIERTYNLEVADFHTFFVGQRFVLVHNECKTPDLNVDEAVRKAKVRGAWRVTKEATERVVRHRTFGKIYKSKSDGLWWSKDNANHGGSQWKVFRETSDGLEWYRDADQYGDFISGKHKGDVGKYIPWKDLIGTGF